MPIYQDKKTGRLFIQFDFQNQTIKRRLPEHTKKKDAEKIEIKLKNDLLFESFGIEKQKEINYEDFLAQYFLPFAKNHYSPDGLKNVVVILKSSLPFFKGCQIRKIQAADIEKFKTYRQNLKTKHDKTRQASTVHRELNIISKIFNMAVKNDFIDYNPCSRIELPAYRNFQDKIIPLDKLQSFLDNFHSDWSRDISILILLTGLRQNDALGLKKFSVDFDNRIIRLIQGKSKREVVLPMNEIVYEILDKRRDNGSELFFPSPKTGKQGTSVKKALAGAASRAGLGKVGTRVLRRSFGTWLDELNYNDSSVAKLLGHSDNRSVGRYKRGTHILREAVESLENFFPAKSLPPTLKLLKKKP
jgi:integrase